MMIPPKTNLSSYILSAQQVRDWDAFTIEHEPVTSVDLMERAAEKVVDWITNQQWQNKTFRIFCGKGNNGGDGLAIARLLIGKGNPVSVYILEKGTTGSKDFEINLQRLRECSADIHFLQTMDHFPVLESHEILIDAIFGSGLNKPVEEIAAALIDHINHSNCLVVAIDIPSGLFTDQSSKGNKVIKADHTLSFQCYKYGLIVQDNAPFTGEVDILDIDLHPDYLNNTKFDSEMLNVEIIKSIYKPRNRFSHKGNFGHALLIGGSYGKMGAAVLAAKACLHSGVGLLTCFIPKSGYVIMQTSIPEAMVMTDEHENFVSQLPNEIDNYHSIGIGPGIGTSPETQNLISFITRRYKKPFIIDADGLNCLAIQKSLIEQLPANSILTPHPKEFDRLFGNHTNDFDRMTTARNKAREHSVIIVLKGHHTMIATPGGNVFFNSTGNAGMAKGGSGDVLTGIITALVAQSYDPVQASIMAVFLHGLAGDFAATISSQESMTATDIINQLSAAFRSLNQVGNHPVV